MWLYIGRGDFVETQSQQNDKHDKDDLANKEEIIKDVFYLEEFPAITQTFQCISGQFQADLKHFKSNVHSQLTGKSMILVS